MAVGSMCGSKCRAPRVFRVRVGVWWLVAALLATLCGCFSRSPLVTPEESAKYRSQAELYMLDHAAARWGHRRPRRSDKRPDYRDGFYLHVAGGTSCSGFLRKQQSTHVYAWVTEGSPTGRIIDAKLINTGFDYKHGFFAGAGASQGGSRAAQVEVHDTIAGFGRDFCQCLDIYASAKLQGRIFLRSYDEFCPEGLDASEG